MGPVPSRQPSISQDIPKECAPDVSRCGKPSPVGASLRSWQTSPCEASRCPALSVGRSPAGAATSCRGGCLAVCVSPCRSGGPVEGRLPQSGTFRRLVVGLTFPSQHGQSPETPTKPSTRGAIAGRGCEARLTNSIRRECAQARGRGRGRWHWKCHDTRASDVRSS